MSSPIAKRVLEFYAGDANRWTQKTCARDASGQGAIPPTDDCAVCWCLVGAVNAARLPPGSAGVLSDEMGFARFDDMVDWNDARDRTFAEVEARLRAAVEGKQTND